MAISCLEKYANHPDTAAIHDPIYALLKGEDLGQQKALERALSAHTSHPAAVELRSILGEELSSNLVRQTYTDEPTACSMLTEAF